MEKTRNGSEEDLKLGSLIDIVLSWTLEDVLNENLYKDKVSFTPFSTLAMKKCTWFLKKNLDKKEYKSYKDLVLKSQ